MSVLTFVLGMETLLLSTHDVCFGREIRSGSTLFHQWEQSELQFEIYNNVVCATSNGSDQPAHTRSLIRAFASPLNILWILSY